MTKFLVFCMVRAVKSKTDYSILPLDFLNVTKQTFDFRSN